MLHLLGSEAVTTCDLDRRTDLPHCDCRTFVFRDVLSELRVQSDPVAVMVASDQGQNWTFKH
jgi:hypothetical protein